MTKQNRVGTTLLRLCVIGLLLAGDLVWIYFSSFTHYSLVEPRRVESGERDEEGSSSTVSPTPMRLDTVEGLGGACNVELRIWDSGGAGEAGAAALGRYCDVAPALCARAALASAPRAPRPCSPPDGYVSQAALLALAATTRAGTATHPLAFALHYEFVDARLEGTSLPSGRVRAEPPACARLLTVPGSIASPRNALWFGRGGARRLRCVYRLQAGTARARVGLMLAQAMFGKEPRCATRPHPLTGRLACFTLPAEPHGPEEPEPADENTQEWDGDDEDDDPLRVPHLKIYESPWPGYRVRFIEFLAIARFAVLAFL